MSRKSSESDQGRWSRAGDAGVPTRRQGLRSRPQLQTQGGGPAAQSSKARGSKRSHPAPPAAIGAGGRKRLKGASPVASGSAGQDQVVERRSERLKNCVRVGYRNLDRFGTKEPFWEEIERSNAGPLGGVDVEEEKAEVKREKQDRGGRAVKEEQVEVKRDAVLKSWGKGKRRRSRARGDPDTGEQEPAPEVWVEVGVREVQGSREINTWIRKSRTGKLGGDLGSQWSTDVSADEIESEEEEVDVVKLAVESPSPARVARKRPRIEKRLADLGSGPKLGIRSTTPAIENRASEVAVDDSASEQDVVEVCGSENAASRPVATGQDALTQGTGESDKEEDEDVRSSADEISEDVVSSLQNRQGQAENDHVCLSEPVSQKAPASSAHGDTTEVPASDLKLAEGDEAVRRTSESHSPVFLGCHAEVSNDEGLESDRAQALPCFGHAGNREMQSLPGTENLPTDGPQDTSEVRTTETNDAENLDHRQEGGILRATSEDDLLKDDVTNMRDIVGESRSLIAQCKSDADELPAAVPHGRPDPCRHDEIVAYPETSSRPEAHRENSTSSGDQTTESSSQLVNATGDERDRGCANVRTELAFDHTHVAEQLLSDGRMDGSDFARLEYQLPTDRNGLGNRQEKIHVVDLSSSKAEAGNFDVQKLSPLPKLDIPSQDILRSEHSCMGGWIEDDERIEDMSENENAEEDSIGGRASLVRETGGFSLGEAEVAGIRDRNGTSRDEGDGMLGGGKSCTDVGLTKALKKTEHGDCELDSGKCMLLPIEVQPQYGGSDDQDTRSRKHPTAEHLVVAGIVPPSPETATNIKLFATVEEARTEAGSDEHEISELQKALLESFRSFLDPGDNGLVPENLQPDHCRQLTDDVQSGVGPVHHSMSLVNPIDHLEKAALNCSPTVSAPEGETQPGYDVQDAGFDGYTKNTIVANTEEVLSYAEEPAGRNSATGIVFCADQMTEVRSASIESRAKDCVGFKRPVAHSDDRLQRECKKPQEGRGEVQNVKVITTNIGIQEVIRSKLEGSVPVAVSHVNVCDGHTVDEGYVIEAAIKLTVATASFGSEVDMGIPLSDTGGQPLATWCMSKSSMSKDSSHTSTVTVLSKPVHQIPIVCEDAQGSALQDQVPGSEADENVKVYSRRKRGRDMEDIDQHFGLEGDPDNESPAPNVADLSFNDLVAGQEDSSSNFTDDEKQGRQETSCPANSHGAFSSIVSKQGGVSQEDPSLRWSLMDERLAVSDHTENQNEAPSMPSSNVLGNSCDKSSPLVDDTSLTMTSIRLEVTAAEVARNLFIEGVCQETLMFKTQKDSYDDKADAPDHHPEKDRLPAAKFTRCACNLEGRVETSLHGTTGADCTSTHESIYCGHTVAAESGTGCLPRRSPGVSLSKTTCVEGGHSEISYPYSEALPGDMIMGEPHGNTVIDSTQADGRNQVSVSELRVDKGVHACSISEKLETAPIQGDSVHNEVARDEVVLLGAAAKHVLAPEQIEIPETVKTVTFDDCKSVKFSCLKDFASLESLPSQDGKIENTILLQLPLTSEDGREPVIPGLDAEALPLLDITRANGKDEGGVCLKTVMGDGSEQSADNDINLASDLHAAYLKSLKCGLCGGSSDGRPPKDMPTEDGKYLRGKSLLDKGEGFEDGEGWLGQLVGPLKSRTGVQGVWVHRQCAIWSPEVYFSGVGRMKNVKAALRRGRYLKCTSCNQPGATIGCCMERCPRTFHLPCARLEGCVFDHVKYLMTCIDHMHLLHPRGQKKSGNDTETGLCEFEDGAYFHVGGFTKMVRERRIAAASARLKDLEAEEKWVENTAEDEEFVRRERKRLQRDLAKMVPVQVGGHTRHEDGLSPSEGWESVAGMEDVIQSLKEVVTLPLLYPDVYCKLGVSPPRGVLLHGYPGTGKTHVVRAMVGACARGGQKVAYFARKGADCLGKYVGDSERQLRLLFQIAQECQPSIIFFDEMDGLAPSRSGQNDQTHSSVVSTLLALMDGLNPRGSVVVIGATNRADALDPALRRPGRFDREIFFPLPATAEREAILALHTRKWVPRPSVGLLSAVARTTSGFAGADLQALCVETALTALRRVCLVSRLVESAVKGESLGDIPPLPTVQVRGADWAAALRHVSPPCSRRKALTACGSAQTAPLPKHMMRILLPSVLEVLLALHLDSRVSLPQILEKVIMLSKQCIISYAGYDVDGTTFPSNWVVLLREWPFESKAGQVLLEALAEAGITCTVDVSELTTIQVSIHSSESDCDSSGKDAGEVSRAKKSQIGAHEQLESNLIPDMLLHEPALGHKKSLQCRANIMIAGPPKAGQSLVAAALLHGFESFGQVRMLSLPTMLQEGNGSVTEGLLSILGEAERTSPCLIFMPNIEHWSLERVLDEDVDTVLETSSMLPESEVPTAEGQPFASDATNQSDMKVSVVASGSWKVLMQFMKSCNKMPIFLLATSELSLEQLPSGVLRFFSSGGSHSNLCGSQTVPSVVVEIPPVAGNLPKILDSASEDIARAMAVDFARKIHRLMLQLNRVDSIPTCGASDSTFKKVVGEQVAAGSSTEPVVNAISSDQEVQIEIGDCQEAKNESPDVIPVGSVEAGIEEVVMECQDTQLGAQSHLASDSDIQHKSPHGHPFEGISAKQKSLISAIVYCGFQLLYDPQFTELRKATAKLKAGPQVNVLDSSGLDTSNVNKYCQRFARKDICPGSSMGSNAGDEAKGIWVRGIVAVGLTAYRGLYSTASEVAWEVRKVIELLHERISKSVQSGANRWDYFPLTSQAAALEDMLGSWRHEVVRLEEGVGQPSGGAVNLASTTRPLLVHSTNASGEVSKDPATEDSKVPAVSPSADSNSATEKAPDAVGDGQSQHMELSINVGTITNSGNHSQSGLTTAGGDKVSVQGGQEAQLRSLTNEKGCRGGDINSSHQDVPQDIQVAQMLISTQLTNTSPTDCVERNDVAAKFTEACLRKLQATVKDVLVDAWRQNGSTTSGDALNDLITSSAASAMMACRRSVKLYEGFIPFLQVGNQLECRSAVCCAQVNCLCITLPVSPDLATRGAESIDRVSSHFAEGTGETGSKIWKDRDVAVSHTKSTVAMHELVTGLCKRTVGKVQNGEGCVCLCPLVMAVKNLKFNIVLP